MYCSSNWLGKSYIAYQLIADNPDSTFLVLTSLKKVEEKWKEELREEGIVGDEKDEWEGREGIEEKRTGERIKSGKGRVHTDIYMNLNSESYHNLDYIILDGFQISAQENSTKSRWNCSMKLALSGMFRTMHGM